MAQSKEALALLRRYSDAYLVGRATVGVGTLFKALGIILGILIVVASIAAIASNERGFAQLGVPGIAFGIFIGATWYIFGILVSAQGEILKAVLDVAVNGSPFLADEQRAKAMSLPQAKPAAAIAGDSGSTAEPIQSNSLPRW